LTDLFLFFGDLY